MAEVKRPDSNQGIPNTEHTHTHDPTTHKSIDTEKQDKGGKGAAETILHTPQNTSRQHTPNSEIWWTD
jgi:hypothetical protein